VIDGHTLLVMDGHQLTYRVLCIVHHDLPGYSQLQQLQSNAGYSW
jgi:hypothetical protein